jgi:RNA polymerase sigma-70 factor (ECF subfamily)
LCRSYWQPIYSAIRHSGFPPHDAEDLAQDFFAHVLRGERLQTADPGKGRFRTFLLGCLKNFLHNERKKRNAAKRGGGVEPESLHADEDDETGLPDPRPCDVPFDREWAATLIAQTNQRLEAEYAAAQKGKLFAAFSPFLSPSAAPPSYDSVARELSMSLENVKVTIHRLRKRYGELLRAAVADTVNSPEDVDGELRWLISVWSE